MTLAGREKYQLRVRVFYHDKCFDGASSAALFSRFYRERIRSDAQFVFSGLLHRAGALFDENNFDGDENAIVDFKYSSSPKITWWFDHHESAFLTPSDAAHFEQDQSNRKFYDPDFKSCTSFIAMIADSLDGRVARMTNTQTAFGAEYDSISDMVSFGIAPALLGYSWGLMSLGKIGWVVAFISRPNSRCSSIVSEIGFSAPHPCGCGRIAATSLP